MASGSENVSASDGDIGEVARRLRSAMSDEEKKSNVGKILFWVADNSVPIGVQFVTLRDSGTQVEALKTLDRLAQCKNLSVDKLIGVAEHLKINCNFIDPSLCQSCLGRSADRLASDLTSGSISNIEDISASLHQLALEAQTQLANTVLRNSSLALLASTALAVIDIYFLYEALKNAENLVDTSRKTMTDVVEPKMRKANEYVAIALQCIESGNITQATAHIHLAERYALDAKSDILCMEVKIGSSIQQLGQQRTMNVLKSGTAFLSATFHAFTTMALSPSGPSTWIKVLAWSMVGAQGAIGAVHAGLYLMTDERMQQLRELHKMVTTQKAVVDEHLERITRVLEQLAKS